MRGPGLAILIGERKHPDAGSADEEATEAPGDDTPAEEDAEYADVKKSAVSDMFAAMKDGDEEAFGSALNDFTEACTMKALADHKKEAPPK